MDLDLQVVGVDTLRNHIRRILQSKSFLDSLAIHDITLEQTSEPKQTQTVQRWKFALGTASSATPIPTKLEFSRREETLPTQFGIVDDAVLKTYRMHPLAASHYGLNEATRQKISALANRQNVQARDLFDLAHLIGFPQNKFSPKDIEHKERQLAQENARSISYQDYESQVLEYLVPEHVELHSGKQHWSNLVRKVEEFLK